MEINRKKLMYAILREANNNSDIVYSATTFEVDELVYTQTLLILKEEEMLMGIMTKQSDNTVGAFIMGKTKPRITLSGLDFLEENNEWSKLYKGLKEIRDWIPFIGK